MANPIIANLSTKNINFRQVNAIKNWHTFSYNKIQSTSFEKVDFFGEEIYVFKECRLILWGSKLKNKWKIQLKNLKKSCEFF